MQLPFIYLASASPRRHELLKQIGVQHEILTVPTSEGAEDEPILAGEAPKDYVVRTAREKAQRALDYLKQQSHRPVHPILAADTCVMIEGQVIDKAHSDEDVRRSLQQLSGAVHKVQTHIVLINEDRLLERSSINTLHMRQLSIAEIEHYVQSGEGLGKAGGYAIQGLGGMLIDKLEGSFTGVVGLPLSDTWELLRSIVD
ncbi:dTTP/UTP pyrophosphatase [Oligella sp. MSHR50489EDL]|uniref:Maf family protein n=1 Tax=Oligella sp. MSHR50489EDL TaxID=3139409 RepID=UPI003D816663